MAQRSAVRRRLGLRHDPTGLCGVVCTICERSLSGAATGGLAKAHRPATAVRVASVVSQARGLFGRRRRGRIACLGSKLVSTPNATGRTTSASSRLRNRPSPRGPSRHASRHASHASHGRHGRRANHDRHGRHASGRLRRRGKRQKALPPKARRSKISST